MSLSNPTIIAGGALGLLLALGTVNNATAGHKGGYAPYHGNSAYQGYHGGYGKHGSYGYRHGRAPMKGYMPHPMYGHPAGAMYGKGYHKAYVKDGSCGGYEKSGYVMKTGMYDAKKTSGTQPAGDIVDIAVGTGNFATLVEAVKAAGLVDTLKGEGPFTVFAPTDEAFAKIDKAALDGLIADKDKLTEVLTYHVVPGKVLSADVVKLNTAKTVQGGEIAIDAIDGVKVNDATVVKTDILASNGVIHVIDTVIMPN